jgi:hypothetical protein
MNLSQFGGDLLNELPGCALHALQRLKKLQLGSLETRRLRNDLFFAYDGLFGLASVDWSSMFSFNSVSITRGHGYKLFAKTNRVAETNRVDIFRHQFFGNRVSNV